MRIYTGGTFDLFHFGHLKFLERCSELGTVTVALNSDEFVEAYKGKKPVMSFDERLAVLLGCRHVDSVIENVGGADSTAAIELVEPQMIAIGSDWATRDYYSQMGFTQTWLDERGIAITYIPYTKGISSTEVRNRLKT